MNLLLKIKEASSCRSFSKSKAALLRSGVVAVFPGEQWDPFPVAQDPDTSLPSTSQHCSSGG